MADPSQCSAIVMASPRNSDSSEDCSPPSRDDQPPEDPPVQPARPDPPVHPSRPPTPSSRTRPRRSGYGSEFVERPPAQVQCECPICLQVLRDPQQVTCCGNSYCKVCIDSVKDSKPCPTCNEAFTTFPDKRLRRTLGGFRVYCSNKEGGCKWVGELGDLEVHLNSKPSSERQLEGCLFEKVACIYCTFLFQRRYINKHHSNNECPNRPSVCEHCGHNASYKEITQGHYQTCLSFPVLCPNKCGIELPRREIEQHVNQDCLLQLVTCDFSEIGCQVELPRRDVPAHHRRDVVGHSEFLLNTTRRTTSDIVAVQSGQNEMQAAVARLQEMVAAQDGRINELQDENRRLQERQRSTNARLKNITLRQSQALFWGLALVLALAAIGIGLAVGNVRDKQMASAESKPASFPLDNGIQEKSANVVVSLAQTLEQVKKDVATEKSEREKTARSLVHVEEEIAAETNKREKMIKSLEMEVTREKNERKQVADTLAQKLTRIINEVATGKSEREKIRSSLNELDNKISMRHTIDRTTTSENINSAINNAIKGIQTRQSAVLNHLQMIPHEVALPFEFTLHEFQKYKTENIIWYSPPFYTHSHGYTLCIGVKAYESQTNYILVYAYLMPGAFDDDLEWPFQGNVTIELINQAEGSRWNPASYVSSRIESYAGSFDFGSTHDHPEVSQRVTSGKRAEYRKVIYRFISHSALDYDAVEGTQYLKDDSLMFRISAVTNVV